MKNVERRVRGNVIDKVTGEAGEGADTDTVSKRWRCSVSFLLDISVVVTAKSDPFVHSALTHSHRQTLLRKTVWKIPSPPYCDYLEWKRAADTRVGIIYETSPTFPRSIWPKYVHWPVYLCSCIHGKWPLNPCYPMSGREQQDVINPKKKSWTASYTHQ